MSRATELEARLLTAIAESTDLAEQGRLMARLDSHRAAIRDRRAAARELELGAQITEPAFTAVRTFERNTHETDWLASTAAGTAADEAEAVRIARAEARIWAPGVEAIRRVDQQEFVEQAKGMARHVASSFGTHREAAIAAFLTEAGAIKQAMTVEEAREILPNEDRTGLNNIVKALSSDVSSFLNSPEDEKRLEAAQTLLREGSRKQAAPSDGQRSYCRIWITGSRRHAAEGDTCAVCGDKIAKDDSQEDPSTWHHDNGEKHDHEAKPGGSKESRLRRRALKVKEMEDRPYEATCPNSDCEYQGTSFVRDDLFQSDDDEAECPECETPLEWDGSSKESSRRTAGHWKVTVETEDGSTKTVTVDRPEDAAITDVDDDAWEQVPDSVGTVSHEYVESKESSRRVAVELTNVGIEGDHGVGTTPDGERVKFTLSDSDREDLSAVLYSDLAVNFSGVSVDEGDIIREGGRRKQATSPGYAFLITKDHIDTNAEGVSGPYGVDPALVEQLHNGAGTAFQMFDDDGELYYEGRFFEDPNGSQDPLFDFGMPNAGCTRMTIQNRQPYIGKRKQAYDDAYPAGHQMGVTDHQGNPIVIGERYRITGTSIEGIAAGLDTRHTNQSMVGSDAGVVLVDESGTPVFTARGRQGGQFSLLRVSARAPKESSMNREQRLRYLLAADVETRDAPSDDLVPGSMPSDNPRNSPSGEGDQSGHAQSGDGSSPHVDPLDDNRHNRPAFPEQFDGGEEVTVNEVTSRHRRTASRPIHEIAAEIEREWGNVNYAARPYLDAMHQLSGPNDMFFMDDAKGIILYFLSNARSFSGPRAKEIKEELKSLIKTGARQQRRADTGNQTEGPWRVDVAGVGEHVWVHNALRFDTPEDAKQYAVDLGGRWMGMDMARVVPSDTPDRESVDKSDPQIVVNWRG